jgi:tricorn protease
MPKWADVKIDVDGIQQRVVEFPVKHANMGALGASEKQGLLGDSTARGMGEDPDEDGFGPGQPRGTLHAFDLKKKKDETYTSNIRGYVLSRDGKKIAWRHDKDIKVADSSSKPAMTSRRRSRSTGCRWK